jgi:hypothetical protein
MSDWADLRAEFPEAAVVLLQTRLDEPDAYVTTSAGFAAEAAISESEAGRLLDAVVARGGLRHDEQRRCSSCSLDLTGVGKRSSCPECHAAFPDHPPLVIHQYVRSGEEPRLIPWFLVVHGMNTRGEWQEHLTWLIGRSYLRMVPVAIYKYGTIRPGVLFRFRQRQLRRKLSAKMKKLQEESIAAHLQGEPDVIAHSFGTWLIANALRSDKSLHIGRLLLLGSIVPPNFPWQELVDSSQVKFILNHGATKDGWVPIAHYGIPDSGPGGTRGFASPVVNVPAEGLGHSDYFDESRLAELYVRVWKPFLSWSTPRYPADPAPVRDWKPAPWLVRKATWSVAVLLFAGAVAAAVAIAVAGTITLWRFLIW